MSTAKMSTSKVQGNTEAGLPTPFLEHLVLLRYVQDMPAGRDEGYGEGTYHEVKTAFVISVKGIWFLMLAGHVMQSIDRHPRLGIKSHSFQLDYRFRPDVPPGAETIGFDYFKSSRFAMYEGEEEIGDFGFLVLDSNYKEFLSSVGVVPFEVGAVILPDMCTHFWLTGVPKELVKPGTSKNGVSQSVTILSLPLTYIECPDSSEVGKEKEVPQYFCWEIAQERDEFDQPIPDIVGMSGGPIIGGGYDGKGNARYGLVGIQSSKLKGSENIIRGTAAIRVFNALITML